MIRGAGDGHGVGMSQEGALGYALHGYSDRGILGRYYTDTGIGQAPRGAVIRVLVGDKVRRVPLERYVRGVVSAEMPASWPLAALEAQAIASRTYALTSHAGGSAFQRLCGLTLAGLRGTCGGNAADERGRRRDRGPDRHLRGQTGYDVLLCELGRDDGGRPKRLSRRRTGAVVARGHRPLRPGAVAHVDVKMSFAAAAARLGGLVAGSLVGIEVTKRGYSPRIVSAEILGSKGQTVVSGPELAARLGLDATWAYFSVATAHGVHAQPDVSHYSRPVGSPAPLASPEPRRGRRSEPAVYERRGRGARERAHAGERVRSALTGRRRRVERGGGAGRRDA